MHPANKSATFFFFSSGLVLRGLNLVVEENVEKAETLGLAGFDWAWLACGGVEPKLALHVEILAANTSRAQLASPPVRKRAFIFSFSDLRWCFLNCTTTLNPA